MRSSALPGEARKEPVSPRRWPLLSVLDDTDARALLDRVQPRAFRRGQAVLHEALRRRACTSSTTATPPSVSSPPTVTRR